MLGKQVTDGAKDHRVLIQEGADLAPEEFGDDLSDDVQGQRIARIQLGKTRLVVRAADDIPFLKEPFARSRLQPLQAQHTRACPAALQSSKLGAGLPGGEEPATLMARDRTPAPTH